MTATGWVQVYRCWCSDSAMDPADLPDACPGHEARVTGRGQTFEGEAVPVNHECAWRPCPDHQPTKPDPAPRSGRHLTAVPS